MAKDQPQLQRVEIQLGIKVVGCQHQEWRFDDMLDRIKLNVPFWGVFKFREEPENPVDPKALLVIYGFCPCGRVAAEFTDDVRLFQQAVELMKPYLPNEYGIYPEVKNVVLQPDGKVQHFDLFLSAGVDAPASVQEAIDSL